MTTQDPSVRLVTEESLSSGPGKAILDGDYVAQPDGGDPVGGVPTKQSDGSIAYAVPGGIASTDNGDGTITLTGSAVVDNGDGTISLAA